jgi:hypothetical protein
MKPVTKTRETVKRRPAETSGLVGAAVVTVALWAFSLEPPPAVVSSMVVLVGALPAVVTWFKER